MWASGMTQHNVEGTVVDVPLISSSGLLAFFFFAFSTCDFTQFGESRCQTDIGEKKLFPSFLSQMVHNKSAIKHDGSEKDEKQLAQNAALQNSLWERLGAWKVPAATRLLDGPLEGHAKIGHPKSEE